MATENPFTNVSVIHTYSRAQAIEDGVLIDTTPMAKEAGIRHPVALTAAAWSSIAKTSEAATRRGESDQGRLWDVVSMLRSAIRAMADAKSDVVHFAVLATDERGIRIEHRLYAKCGPGDAGKPMITVLLPGED